MEGRPGSTLNLIYIQFKDRGTYCIKFNESFT